MNQTGMTDPGHGGFDPGACGNGLRECDLTWRFGTKFAEIMERCGVYMYLTRQENTTATNNKNAELGYRCQLANQKGVSFYISFHTNAGGGTGFESYRYLGNYPETVRLQQLVHGRVAPIFTSNGMPDRGMKMADFAVLRGTNMPAILLELGFIDNARDAKYISANDFENQVTEAVARGVCEWLGISFITETLQTPAQYKLFYDEMLQQVWAEKLEAYARGWEAYNAGKKKAYLVEPNGNYYTFEKHLGDNPMAYKLYYEGLLQQVWMEKTEAYIRGWEAYNAGKKDTYLINPEGWNYTFDKHQEENHLQHDPNQLQETPILGDAMAVTDQLIGHAKTVNPQFPDVLATMYLQTGKRYGVKGDIAFAQMLHETNYFRFGKDVQPNQNNFAGLGASFTTVAEGVQAHIQHLYGYASTGPIPDKESLVDPRFNLLTRGSVTTWEGLNGHWAIPGTNYGQDILGIYKKITQFVVTIDPLDEAKANGFLIGDPNQSITAGNVALLLNQLFHKLGGK